MHKIANPTSIHHHRPLVSSDVITSQRGTTIPINYQSTTSGQPIKAIDIRTLMHFSPPTGIPKQFAHSGQLEVTVAPNTYFSTGPSFDLPPQNYFVGIICHVPAVHHGIVSCVLLRGAFDLPEHSVCLMITNISHAVHIRIPRHCDLYTFIDNPLMKITVCHIKTNTIPNPMMIKRD